MPFRLMPSPLAAGQALVSSALHQPSRRDCAAAAFAAIVASMSFWTLLTSFGQATASADNIEQLVWAQHFAWGYPKHPPLPTWLLIAASAPFGRSVPLTYTLAALCVGTALILMWIGCARLAGRRIGLTALLLSTCIYYFTGRSGYFNHNTVLLPFVAGAYLAFIEVVATGRRRAWYALGAAIGMGMLAKYQMALFALTFLAWLAADGTLRTRDGRLGALACCALAGAIVAPHLAWQWAHDWPAFGYAARNLAAAPSWLERLRTGFGFLAQQVARVLPALVVYAVARFERRARRTPDLSGSAHSAPTGCEAVRPGPQTSRPGSRGDRAAQAFVFCATAPVLTITAMGLVAGSRLQNHWGVSTVLPLLAAAGVWLGPRAQVPLRRVLGAVLACHALTAALFLMPRFVSARDHQTFPVDALATLADAHWRAHGAGALRVVIGPQWETGALALRMADRPLAMAIEERALWTPQDAGLARRCGALVIWNADVPAHRDVPRRLHVHPDAVHEIAALRPAAADAPVARLGIAVLPASAAGGCEAPDTPEPKRP